RLVRLPGKALAVGRDGLAARGQDDRGVRDGVADSLVDAARQEPELRLLCERAQPLCQLARDADREVEWRRVILEERRQRHQVQLRREDELQVVERRTKRADIPLELLERRGRVSRNARCLQPCDEERAARHGVRCYSGKGHARRALTLKLSAESPSLGES